MPTVSQLEQAMEDDRLIANLEDIEAAEGERRWDLKLDTPEGELKFRFSFGDVSDARALEVETCLSRGDVRAGAIALLCAILAEWNLTHEGEPLALTPDGMDAAGTVPLVWILKQLKGSFGLDARAKQLAGAMWDGWLKAAGRELVISSL